MSVRREPPIRREPSVRRKRSVRRDAVAVLLACAVGGGATALSTPAHGDAAGPVAAEERAVPRLVLPAPTGPHAVGRGTLHLVDPDRRDPWVPRAGARELRVALYYPARAGTGRPAPYLTRAEARAFLDSRDLDLPARVLSSTRTHVRADARPAPGRFPLVVLSPGFSVPGATLTGLAADLTSRGYVVAVVDHAYEAAGVEFPGRGVLPCAACGKVDDTTFPSAARGRAEDLALTLDELTGAASPWPYARLIDRHRVGAAGHSLGGAASAATMARDPRVRAVANLDGPFVTSGGGSALPRRPLLMMGTAADHAPGGRDTSWETVWRRHAGWKRWTTVTGADHFSFTDLGPLAGQLGEDDPRGLPGKRAGEITRAYVAAFFDRHLRGRHRPLLDGPSAAHPEVTFPHATGQAAQPGRRPAEGTGRAG
ncbi:alpha/beta hydrolase family protein [Streptomyces sp. G45]|uniref:alpha/beta hydrolase family protein n=1 Tax=Streptomyces sp. G45 TaxID=3406627 RepID=UPI003C1FF532